MSIVRYNSNYSPLMKDFFGADFFSPFFERRDLADWNPRVDVYEDGDVLKMDFELPGVPKDNVKITLKDGVLTVTGDKLVEEEKKERTWFYKERSHGCFARHFRLGDNYDSGKIDAKYESGILHVSIPKREEVRPVEIRVK